MTRETKQFIGIGAGALVLYFGVVSPLLKALGLQKKEETVRLDNEVINPNSFWNPNFWKGQQNAVLMPRVYTETLAQSIYDSVGPFNDCEECVINVFKTLKYQTQCSWLADIFQQRFGEDMLTFLRGGSWPQDRLSDNDVYMISQFIQNLPVK